MMIGHINRAVPLQCIDGVSEVIGVELEMDLAGGQPVEGPSEGSRLPRLPPTDDR